MTTSVVSAKTRPAAVTRRLTVVRLRRITIDVLRACAKACVVKRRFACAGACAAAAAAAARAGKSA